MIQRLNVKGVPIQIQDLIFTYQRNEQRKRGCYGCGKLGHFVEVCLNMPTPKTKKKARKGKVQALTSIKTWDDSSSEDEAHHKRHGYKHSSSSSSHVCLMARGNESSSSSENNSDENDEEPPSYDELMKQVQFFNEVCIKQRKQLSEFKIKCTKAKLKNCDNTTDKELLIIIDNLKMKLASSNDVHENLLIKMKLLEEQNNELVSKL